MSEKSPKVMQVILTVATNVASLRSCFAVGSGF